MDEKIGVTYLDPDGNIAYGEHRISSFGIEQTLHHAKLHGYQECTNTATGEVVYVPLHRVLLIQPIKGKSTDAS